MEDKLKVSREITSKLQGQLETQKAGYEEQIDQLEAQIMELFRMLKEVDKGVNRIMENSGGMDRRTLIETLEKHMQRRRKLLWAFVIGTLGRLHLYSLPKLCL